MKVYIIVPVFSNPELTELFLKSLGNKNNYERVILVDDNPKKLHNKFNTFKFIDIIYGNGTNYWGGSVNLGVKHLRDNYNLNNDDLVIFANNDIVIDFNFTDILKRDYNFKKAAFHVQVKDNNSNYIKSCGEIRFWFPFLQDYPRGFKAEVKEVDTLTGRFLILSGLLLNSVKGIDPKLPHYGGDTDLGLKLKTKGFKSYLLRDFTCVVNLEQTGIVEKARINQLVRLLTDIKSSFCIKYKWVLVRNHNNLVFSVFVMFSIYFKLVVIIIKNHLK
tara:strand:- start:7651 stop:8475 length:825 start_codon:yes stop_codon:yes gene_type:complete